MKGDVVWRPLSNGLDRMRRIRDDAMPAWAKLS